MKLRETWVDTSVWRARRRRQAEEAVDAVGGVVAGSTKEAKAAVNVKETKKVVSRSLRTTDYRHSLKLSHWGYSS